MATRQGGNRVVIIHRTAGKIKLGRRHGMFYGLRWTGIALRLAHPVSLACTITANGGKWDAANREWHMLQIRYYLQGGRTCLITRGRPAPSYVTIPIVFDQWTADVNATFTVPALPPSRELVSDKVSRAVLSFASAQRNF